MTSFNLSSASPSPDGSASLTVALAPLDERPVNTRYPQMIGAIAGADVLLPPPSVGGRQRAPADTAKVADWLRSVASDAVIASAEYIVHGNLINARINNGGVVDALPRLALLDELTEAGKRVYAFSLLTRVSNADDSVEEPLYWADWGTRFYRYSQLWHQRDSGAALTGDEAQTLADLEAVLPPHYLSDWLERRLRNHTINLALLDMLARDRLAFLLITSDDTSTWGLPSREKLWLESWLRLLGPRVQAKTMMHPGADEVGSALVARLVCEHRGVSPRLYPLYAVPGGEEIVAPYEDRAVRITVEGQIRACGAQIAASPDDADIILGVLPPSPRRTEFRDDFAEAERRERAPHYRVFFDTLARFQAQGRPVAVGDVAYPNGSDPLALEMLLDPGEALNPSRLAAYGAWNTAGNTLGTVVAQAVCSLFTDGDPAREQAQARFLAHRFLEDWGYQGLARRDARTAITARTGKRDPDPDDDEQVNFVRAHIEANLGAHLARLQTRGVGAGLSLVPGSIRLPWRRLFEADFDLA